MLSYDQGGMMPPGLSMAWNGTGRDEPVGGGSADQMSLLIKATQQQNMLLAQHISLTRRLIATTAAVPGGIGRQVGGAVGAAAQSASFRSRFPRSGS